jgi:PTS system nitrogen regulatory IIA component
MNPLGELLGSDDVRLDVDASSKEEVLRNIASLLAARHRMSEAAILDGMHTREQLGSTGVGHGVAIPHARMTQCNAAAAVFVRTKTAVPFDAPDGKPVSVFLGLIVPNMANERHLQLLATAAGMLGDRAFRDKLRAATDPPAARELLTAWPDAPAGTQ